MLNKSILVGRLTADPELRQTPSGVSVCTFTVACNRPYKTDGERQADFIDVVAWRETAQFVAKYFRKGNAIGIDGSIQTRSYTDKHDHKRKAVEVVAEKVSFVESKSSGGADGSSTGHTGAAQGSFDIQRDSNDSDDFEEILDDGELPF